MPESTDKPADPIKIAPAPFNNESADLVLRTSDCVDLYVWKGILIEASPVFGDMVALGKSPRAPDSTSDGTTTSPVVLLTEGSKDLELFLRMCYPPPHPSFPNLDAVRSAIAVAHKYQAAGILRALQDLLIEKWAQPEPLRAFAVAVQFDLADALEASARSFLAVPSNIGSYVPELESIGAGAYHRLLAYRNQCADALDALVKSNLAWLSQGAWQFMSCPSCPASTATCRLLNSTLAQVPRTWFWEHHTRMGELLRDRPCSTPLADPTLLERGIVDASNRCGTCRVNAPEMLRLFNDKLREEVDRRIAAIPTPQIHPPVAP